MTDFFVAGSWRNKDAILEVLDALESERLTSYCFIRATYSDHAAALATPGGADNVDLDSDAVRDLFTHDLDALRNADRFLLVLPAGQAAHIEAGIAYGLGKPCFAVGPIHRSETLYRIFQHIFEGPDDLRDQLDDSGTRRPRDQTIAQASDPANSSSQTGLRSSPSRF